MSHTTPDWLLIVIGLFIILLGYWLKCAQTKVRLLTENCGVLVNQVAALQAHPNSWQSGYNAGRKMGTATAYSERDQMNRLLAQANEDRARLDSGMIIIVGRDEFGEPTRTHARGLDLRRLIDEAIEEHTRG